MKTSSIRIIIFLAIVGVIGILINQYIWVSNSSKIEDNIIEIQKLNLEMEAKQFDDRVTLALVGVRDELISFNKDASGVYLEPVKQITKNYYVVSFYDTLNPVVLENLLVDKFEEYHIKQGFEYGIYDCFTDSIIFDKYVNLSTGEIVEKTVATAQQKWEHDGHYFGVYFPRIEQITLSQKEDVANMFMWSSLIVFVVLSVFSIAILTILKQKRLSEVKTDFINNMTHELKTPISTIALSSEVLKSEGICEYPDRVQRYAHIISAENLRLESQVERVLQLAKLDKGKIELKNEKVDVHQLIEKSLPAFQLVIEQRNGKLYNELNADNSVVYGDKVHLTNVIYNLLDNAIKYSPNAPNILIKTSVLNSKFVLEITDNGKGMTKEQTKQIFDKFYRVPTGSVHDVKGFGLGLYYVKEIIKAHKGRVSVSSNIGKGSRFSVELPF